MAQKSVVTRERSASSVSAALDTFTPSIQERLVALAAPDVGPGEAMPEWSAALHLLARMLDRSAANIRGADERHEAELRDDDAPREARDAAVSELTDAITELREVITGLFGAKLPAPRVKGAAFDAKAVAKRLRGHVKALDAATTATRHSVPLGSTHTVPSKLPRGAWDGRGRGA